MVSYPYFSVEADNNLACQRNDSCTLELKPFVVVTKAHKKVKKVSLLLLQGVSLSISWRSGNSLANSLALPNFPVGRGGSP